MSVGFKNMKSAALLFLTVGTIVASGCNKGCMKCSGITAPREICDDDFTQNGDFENEIAAYEAAGGVCEEN